MALYSPNGNTNISTVNGWNKSDTFQFVSGTATFDLSTGARTTVFNPTQAYGLLGVRAILDNSLGGVLNPLIDYDVTVGLIKARGTCTISNGTPAVITPSAAVPANGTIVMLDGGTMNTGLVVGTRYYVVNAGATTFNVSLTNGGAAVATTSAGSGTHYYRTDVCVANGDASDAFQTKTASQMTNGIADRSGNWNRLFSWTSFPITNTANTWGLVCYQSNGTTGKWQLPTTSTSQNDFVYCLKTDILGTPTTNVDAIWINNEVVTFDANFIPKWQTAVNSQPGIVLGSCDSAPTIGNSVANFIITANSINFTLGGYFWRASHSCIRIGTSGSPVTGVVMSAAGVTFTITQAPTSGTRFHHSDFVYGTYPTREYFRIGADAAVGATAVISADDVTSYVAGDTFVLGGQDVAAQGTSQNYTVISVTGAVGSQTINFSPGIVTNAIKANPSPASGVASGYGVRTNGWGILWTILSNTVAPSNIVFSGVAGTFFGPIIVGTDDLANTSIITFTHCSNGTTNAAPLSSMITARAGMSITYFYGSGAAATFTTASITANVSGLTTVSHVILIGTQTVWGPTPNGVFEYNSFENWNFANTGSAVLSTTRYNNYWGSAAATAVTIGTGRQTDRRNNQFNRLKIANIIANTTGFVSKNDYFGNLAANTFDISFTINALNGAVYDTPMTNITIDSTNQAAMSVGSYFAIINYNNTANDDRIWTETALLRRTGYGLTDTTVWNGTAFAAAAAGQFGWSIQPISGTILFDSISSWGSTKTTGNITGKTVSVSARMKIANAGYYAGVYTLPYLKVIDNDGTVRTASMAANTSDQQLQISWTPATAGGSYQYGVSMASDAVANALVYLGEMIPTVPPGNSIDNTRYTYSSFGKPLPNDSTIPTPGSVWDELTAAHSVTGTFGQKLKIGANASIALQ